MEKKKIFTAHFVFSQTIVDDKQKDDGENLLKISVRDFTSKAMSEESNVTKNKKSNLSVDKLPLLICMKQFNHFSSQGFV